MRSSPRDIAFLNPVMPESLHHNFRACFKQEKVVQIKSKQTNFGGHSRAPNQSANGQMIRRLSGYFANEGSTLKSSEIDLVKSLIPRTENMRSEIRVNSGQNSHCNHHNQTRQAVNAADKNQISPNDESNAREDLACFQSEPQGLDSTSSDTLSRDTYELKDTRSRRNSSEKSLKLESDKRYAETKQYPFRGLEKDEHADTQLSDTFPKTVSLKSNPKVETIFHEIDNNLQKVMVNIRDVDSVIGSRDRSISRERVSQSINRILEKQKASRVFSYRHKIDGQDCIPKTLTISRHISSNIYSPLPGNINYPDKNIIVEDQQAHSFNEDSSELEEKEIQEYSKTYQLTDYKVQEGSVQSNQLQDDEGEPRSLVFFDDDRNVGSSRNLKDQKSYRDFVGTENRENFAHFKIQASPRNANLRANSSRHTSLFRLRGSASPTRKPYEKFTSGPLNQRKMTTNENKLEKRMSIPIRPNKSSTKVADVLKSCASKIEASGNIETKSQIKMIFESKPREFSPSYLLKDTGQLNMKLSQVYEPRNFSEQPNKNVSGFKFLGIQLQNHRFLQYQRLSQKNTETGAESKPKAPNIKKTASYLISNITRKTIARRYGDICEEAEKRPSLRTQINLRPRPSKVYINFDKLKSDPMTAKAPGALQPYYKSLFPKCMQST